MNLPDHFGTGQVQDIVVAFQVYRMGDKFTTAKIGFCQTVLLDSCSHGSVEDQNPLLDFVLYHSCTFVQFKKV
jgi:hypothetical protein